MAQNSRDIEGVNQASTSKKVKKSPKIVLKKHSTVEEPIAETVINEQTDNLTLIEGIGPKIARVLNDNDIYTFRHLATLSIDSIKDILQKNNLKLADPTTWATQADLAAQGKIEELKALKKELKYGK